MTKEQKSSCCGAIFIMLGDALENYKVCEDCQKECTPIPLDCWPEKQIKEFCEKWDGDIFSDANKYTRVYTYFDNESKEIVGEKSGEYLSEFLPDLQHFLKSVKIIMEK